MPLSMLRTMFCGLLLAALALPLGAQEEEPQPAPAAADVTAEDFPGLLEQWKNVEQQLGSLARNYREATSDQQRREILASYEQLTTDSRALLTGLRAAAQANYEAAPNENSDAAQVLLSFVAQDLREDRVDEAWQLGTMLRENGTDSPALPALLGVVAYARDDFATSAKLLKEAQAAGSLTPEGEALLEDLPQATSLWQKEQNIRQQEAAADDLPRVRLETSEGDIVVELYENEAPQTVGNFVSLVEKGYYDGLTFHRVLPGFMAQGGCPEGTGSGGPGYTIFCETTNPQHRKHFRGVLSMAKTAQPNTGGSQFFLTFRRTPHLDGLHTVFGRVIEGHEVLAKLQRRDPTRPGQPEPDRIVKAEVLRKRDHVYEPTKVE